jgi:hypothetical protein
MIKTKVYVIISLLSTLITLMPAANAQVGFGFGFGGRHGGFSFGVGRPYGYWGYGYRPWRYGHWGYRPWYRDWDWDYDYYPSSRYVVRESPVSVEYVTRKTTVPVEDGLDRKGKDYWRINNKTDMDIVAISDADNRELKRDDRNKKLFREDEYTIKIQTPQGKSATFTKVHDHNVDVIIGKDGALELETWNE